LSLAAVIYFKKLRYNVVVPDHTKVRTHKYTSNGRPTGPWTLSVKFGWI